MNKFKLTVLAASLGLAPLAHADTNADILNELQALKAKVQQLEAQVKAQQTQITDNQKATDEATTVANHADVQVSGIKEETESSGFKGLKISGMIAPAYVYNQDQQSSSFVFLNRSNGDPSAYSLYNYDNSYFGGAYIQFQKKTAGGVGWNLTLAPDRGAGVNMNGNSIIHEASVSIPVNNDTKIIAGQIPDWEGYEYTWDNQTKTITHNLLFDFAELTAYTGVGIDQTVGDWEWKSMIANVNSPRYYYGGDGGRAPALVFRADYSIPGYDSAGVGFWGLVGKLPNSNVDLADGTTPVSLTGTTTAQMFEVDGYLNQGNWGYYGQASFGQQAQAAYNNGKARWWGLSGLLTYNFTPRFLGLVRADYLNNSHNGGGLAGGYMNSSSGGAGQTFNGVNGFGPGYVNDGSGNWAIVDPNKGANRYALTVGWNYLLTESTTLKMEYRYDRSSLATFYNVSDGSYKKDNNLLAASVVVSF
ncbi:MULTISPECIES: DUF3138 family protein [unclassified Thiomonas]|uniref:DUF3138 family protein n=1 Tax=unclassified Thiomonas TaxID=2625466 RepID=UPI0004DBB769|nr:MULTISPECIES: DUF3138 family protein [unclassified Thiomonas]CQR42629.1 conserved exported hypothetical protein [Thiomonas sp. CB3]CDW92929.1 conserved exported hypothetical protein [Thiomonas sp. CB2]VDY05365.1 conserved exported protein of unknown function [Thiomonas sp. Bio17B3]VDY07472.1 conserved exported protein of unknown function [Thiomonas sp. Sup16B3]VDY13614.1 conserved hypothetical protein; putative exported protein [Thiomonas sp. OC7]